MHLAWPPVARPHTGPLDRHGGLAWRGFSHRLGLHGRPRPPRTDLKLVRKGVDRRAMSVLSAGHLFTDVNQGAVAALVPFLVAERGLSLAAAGSLVLAATLSSSIVQPLFGYFSDNRPLPVLMPLGVVLGGVGISLAGVAPSYPLILACILLSGLGVAAFHPESARFA